MLKTILLAALILAVCAPAVAQKSPQAEKSANAVKWAFPKAGQTPSSINGEVYYELAEGILAKRTTLGESKNIEASAVYFSPKALAVFRLVQVTEPKEIPNLDRFLIMMAVHLSVEDPLNKGFHKYIGPNMMYGELFYFYQLKNGQFIAARIADDQSHVLILPGPATN
jgi:hypothetical protein